MKIKTLLNYEWDAIAGLLAAVAAIILNMLNIVNEHEILLIVLALMGLLFINFMRHTRNNEHTAEQIDKTEHVVRRIQSTLKSPDIVLVGPRQLRTVNERFARHMKEDVIMYNVCLSMYQTQPLFDALLRPVVENPMVTSVQFVLDKGQMMLWQEEIQPKILACSGYSKVKEPYWCTLEKNISFILADSHHSGGTEALLSFWGEPFMAQSTGWNVPRYIFHVQKNSELLPHLVELERVCMGTMNS